MSKKTSSPASLSEAQIIFKDKELLLERLPDMTQEEYRILRRIQSEVMKRLFHKGKAPNRQLARLHPAQPFTKGHWPSLTLTQYLNSVSAHAKS